MPREIVWLFQVIPFHNIEKGYFSASVTHGASAAHAGSAPHRDQHLHSPMSTVNKKPVTVIQELNTAWSENSVVKCCMKQTFIATGWPSIRPLLKK